MITVGIDIHQSTSNESSSDPFTLSKLLPDSGHRTMRSTMTNNHFPGTSEEQEFTGFTDTELSGFVVQTATDASDLMTKLSDQTTTQNLIIELDWDGNSSTGDRAFGFKTSKLVANALVDWGYDRPTARTLIRPATGKSPTLTGTFNGIEMYLIALNIVEFRDIVFENTTVRLEATSTFPCLAISAFKNCTFQNNGSGFGLRTLAARSVHVEDCTFSNMQGGISGAPNYGRYFNNVFVDHGENDIIATRLYNKTEQANWTAHHWVAGNLAYDHDNRNPTSRLHPDFFQISHNDDAHDGYSCLVEGNIAHLNRDGANSGSQGVFGDDGSGYDGEWLVHNNLIIMSAYWACLPFDPNDNSDKVVVNNMFGRTADLSDGSSVQDTVPTVRGIRVVSGSGTLEVKDNYAGVFTTGIVSGEDFSGNVILDPQLTAAVGTSYSEVITGNSSYVAGPGGFTEYTSPDAGAASASVGKAALIAFWKPLAGWGVNAGPFDPNRWPSDWTNIST